MTSIRLWAPLQMADIPQCMAEARAPSTASYTQCQNSVYRKIPVLARVPTSLRRPPCFPACKALLWPNLELATESQTMYQKKHLAACSTAQPKSIPV